RARSGFPRALFSVTTAASPASPRPFRWTLVSARLGHGSRHTPGLLGRGLATRTRFEAGTGPAFGTRRAGATFPTARPVTPIPTRPPVATSSAFRARTATCALAFATAAALRSFGQLTARSRHHSHLVRPGPDTEETAGAFFHDLDHDLGARETKGIESLSHRVIEGLAFENHTLRFHHEPRPLCARPDPEIVGVF